MERSDSLNWSEPTGLLASCEHGIGGVLICVTFIVTNAEGWFITLFQLLMKTFGLLAGYNKPRNMIKSTTKKNVLGAIALSAVLPIAAQAAVVTWDNGGTGSLWTTAENWSNNAVPTNADQVTIGNGFTVDYDVTSAFGNIQPATLNVDGTLNLTTVTRANGRTIDVGATGSITGSGFFDLDRGTFTFENGADVSTTQWEQKGTNIFSYNLGASGFQTLTPGTFRFGGGATIANATYNVDMASYTGGLGIITLMDFGSDAGSMDNATFQGAGGLNVLNNGGYTANLQWNDTTEAIELNITAVPEPSSAALLGLGGVALILRRRK